MNDHVLLNISAVTGKWVTKFVFNFNLTGVYIHVLVIVSNLWLHIFARCYFVFLNV